MIKEVCAMYRIKTYNRISPIGLDRFDPARYSVSESQEHEDGILVRSAKLHEMPFSPELLAISRAGVGVNNIPIDRCSEAGIAVFNTPGANANAVKELVLCALLMGSRDIDGSICWVRDQVSAGVDVTTVVEQGKSLSQIRCYNLRRRSKKRKDELYVRRFRCVGVLSVQFTLVCNMRKNSRIASQKRDNGIVANP